ncbi:hypothetical protein RYR54_001270 [Aeromonas sobria]|nr:hypothetical protein [Aeromonas sobria]
MRFNEDILHFLLEQGTFEVQRGPIFERIVRVAPIDGYAGLSNAEQQAIQGWFSRPCCGQTHTGEPQDCPHTDNNPLTGEALLNAYEASNDSDFVQCDQCRDEDNFVADRIANGIARR